MADLICQDELRQLLDAYDDMPDDGPIGDLVNDIRLRAQRLGWRRNTCGSPVEWSRRYLARQARA